MTYKVWTLFPKFRDHIFTICQIAANEHSDDDL